MTKEKTLVFATNNPHKLEELRQIIGEKIRILSLYDIDCHEEIPEPFPTLEQNALQKAKWVKEHYGYDCFADDTGLEVEALNGEPGVRSARYAGEGHDSNANMNLLLKNMAGVENRAARFRTIIALIEGNTHKFFEGVVEGNITMTPSGNSGFGYDPIFCPKGWKKTFAEAGSDEKNAISHRGCATRKLVEYLKNQNS